MILVGSIETLIKFRISHVGIMSLSLIILFIFFKVLFVHCQSGVPVMLELTEYKIHSGPKLLGPVIQTSKQY